MNYKRRGKLIIFNQRVFENNRLPAQEGTDDDIVILKATFEKLGFIIIIFEDLKRDQISALLENCNSPHKYLKMIFSH